MNGSPQHGPAPPSAATPPAPSAAPAATPTWSQVQLAQQRPPPSEKERRMAEERLGKLRQDVDAKRISIKNLKIALEKLDITE